VPGGAVQYGPGDVATEPGAAEELHLPLHRSHPRSRPAGGDATGLARGNCGVL